MTLPALFAAFSEYLHSPQFLDLARHPDHANAFVRKRKLPLPSVLAILLAGMRKSVQAELDEFFAHLQQQAQLLHQVSERAFRRARSKVSAEAIPALNQWLIDRAEADGLIPRWRGLRLVAADASTLHFGVRASQVPHAARADQIAFGLFLPGAEMMLAASLHSIHEHERQMLVEHLDHLSCRDLLLMDRGYPCRWLPALLIQRGIGFCMRIDRSGPTAPACVRDFLRSGREDAIVTLPAPDHRDAADYECPATPQTVRLIRHRASTGSVRVLMTNLLDTQRFPAVDFGDLYHQRWRIEEAFKRLKHRLNLEHVSGLSQLAVMQDFAAKIVCDNLHALATQAAHHAAQLLPRQRINRTFACSVLKPLLPALLLGSANATLLLSALYLIARKTFLHRPGQSKPRGRWIKPRKSMTQKPC